MLSSVASALAGIYYPTERIQRRFDFVIDLFAIETVLDSPLSGVETAPVGQLSHLVNPGGYFLTCEGTSPSTTLLASPALWVGTPYSSPLVSFPSLRFFAVKKRAICCNTRAAPYWGASGADVGEEATSQLAHERDLLEEITVPQMVQSGADYRKYGPGSAPLSDDSPGDIFLRMSSAGREKAVSALRTHGVCVVRNLFPAEVTCDEDAHLTTSLPSPSGGPQME
jgi:hypothetical protein